jgi:hypothetical protein
MAEPITPPSRPVPPPVTDRDADAYRPLSLLALAGFVVACLWALIVVLGGVAAVLAGSPWLMPLWTFLLPLAGAALAGVALFQIRQSEGTRAGAALAVWGLLLSVLFGLGYGAYVAATRLAVEQQAKAVAQDWFDKLRDGKVYAAYRLTIDPARRSAVPEGDPANPADPELREALETRFNVGDAGGKGALSQFEQNFVVRSLVQAGRNAEVKPLGINQLDYEHDGYVVKLNYGITTPEAVTEVVLALRGRTSPNRAFKGRQWGIAWAESRPRPDHHKLTPRGEQVGRLRQSAAGFIFAWMKKLADGRLDEAFLDTCAPDDRPPRLAAYGVRTCGALLAGCPAAADPELARRLFLPGYAEFADGALVRAEPGTFWAMPQNRAVVPEEFKKLFQRPRELLLPTLRPDVSPPAPWSRDDKTLRVAHDFQMVVGGKHNVEGRIVVETDAAALESSTPPAWRLAAFELVRSKAVADGPPRPQP